MAHKGPAYKGPGGPTSAQPTRAHGAHKGLACKGPEGPCMQVCLHCMEHPRRLVFSGAPNKWHMAIYIYIYLYVYVYRHI